MSVTLAQVINQARDEHPALSVAAAPPTLAPRQVTKYARDLYESIAVRVPGFLTTSVALALPLANFTAGQNLTALIPGGWKDLLDLTFTYNTGGTPPAQVKATGVPYEQRDLCQPLPSWTLAGDVLYLLGGPNDYTSYAGGTLTYTPAPVTLSQPTDLVCQSGGLPDDALDCLALMLAAFYLGRLVEDPGNAVSEKTFNRVAASAGAARTAFLRRIYRLTQRQNYRIRDVMGRSSGRGGMF
jgi:hypothetical protein